MAVIGDKLIQFTLLTRAQFDAMQTYEPRVLYFISDTKELYRGNVNYSSAVVFHADGERPALGAIGKLYFNTNNGEGTTWNGSAWVTVIPHINESVTDAEGKGVTLPVSGIAVKNYVDTVAANTLAKCVTNITWDDKARAVVYTVDNKNHSVPLTKLGTTLAYNAQTGVVSLKDLNNNTISEINIPLDNFVTGGSYNDQKKALILNFKNGTNVEIPAASLVQLYHDYDTPTVDVTIRTDEQGNNVIAADIKLSATPDNAIEIKEDGLYIPPTTTKMDKVGEGHEDEVIIADYNGNAKASGYKIGADTLNSNLETQKKLLATEAAVTAVKNDIEQRAEDTYVKLQNVISSAEDIDVNNPDADKVISEYALVEAMSWNEIPDE